MDTDKQRLIRIDIKIDAFMRVAVGMACGLVLTGIVVSSSAAAGPVRAVDIGLIDAVHLAKEEKQWVVLDARPKSEWQTGHIPGSISFSWEAFTRTDEKGVRYRVWPPQELAEALGKRGIDENTAIAVYGDADKSWGGEGWVCWVLAWLGHTGPIRLLEGGIQSWRSHALPLTVTVDGEAGSGAPTPAVDYRYNLRPELDIRASELEEKAGSAILIDTRSKMEWWKGHIPGAIHIPWTDFYTGKDRRPLGADTFSKLLTDHGVDTRKPVIYYCTGGVRSGYAWMVHALSGLPTARNYEGGMEDWDRRTDK